MAEKKPKPKAKAKAKKKTIDQTGAFDAVQLPEVELSPELEAQINVSGDYDIDDDYFTDDDYIGSIPMQMEKVWPVDPAPMDYTASDLAAMARAAKAGKADMQDVIKAHEAYLKAIAQGASAPAADVDFVKNHLKHIKTL